MPVIVCPECGNRGEANDERGVRFEMRGKFEGCAVRKCLKCEVGLLIGAFSGGILGRPKVIPLEVWKRMQAMWAEEIGSHAEASEHQELNDEQQLRYSLEILQACQGTAREFSETL